VNRRLAQSGPPSAWPAKEVDAWDVLAVRARCPAGGSRGQEQATAPRVLECLTYRFRGHSLRPDPDANCAARRKKAFWAQRDPIKALAAQLISGELARRGAQAIEAEIDAAKWLTRSVCVGAPETRPQRTPPATSWAETEWAALFVAAPFAVALVRALSLPRPWSSTCRTRLP